MNLVFKALADPTRRRVLQLLRERPMTAGEIADHFPVAKATLSGHFAVLKEAELIAAEKQGATITYQLRLSVLEDALLAFADSFGIGFPATELSAARPARKAAHSGKA
jgi:DNA-binding transcriptional ArsR family regulator